jgi:hypothetical protein
VLAVAAGGESWKVIVPLVVAVIGFTALMIRMWWDARASRLDRLRELYAGGWAAVQAYKEMAFAIRRRNIEDRAGERVRLSEALAAIQKDLSYHEALIARERSGKIAAEYSALVSKTREIAGDVIRDSWNDEPITKDSEMHSPEIAQKLTHLERFEEGYMNAVANRLGVRSPH